MESTETLTTEEKVQLSWVEAYVAANTRTCFENPTKALEDSCAAGVKDRIRAYFTALLHLVGDMP